LLINKDNNKLLKNGGFSELRVSALRRTQWHKAFKTASKKQKKDR